MARGFKIADAYVDIHADRDGLKRDVDGIPAAVGPAADRAGKGVGDKVSQGMRMAFIRNSPLIVAAIGGALAAGGPAALTAATGLFAGIGIVAAAQSQKVRQAWLGTWQAVKQGAAEDARPIEAVLVGLADRVQQRYQAMRPVLRDIFSDAAPQIDMFAEGMFRLAENAMPGFQRAVERGMPVTQGFAAFLEKTGTGLTGFFDNISEHGPAAGAVWSSLGDSFAALLPLLGELLGQGTELAADVLPLLSGSLSAVLTVTEALGPLLPVVAAGWGAWRIVGTIGPMLDRMNASLATHAQNAAFASYGTGQMAGAAGRASSTMGRAASVVAGFGRALPVVGVAVGALAAIMASGSQRTNDYASALMAGGAAARKAAEDLGNPGVWEGIQVGFSNIFDADAWKGASAAELQLEDVREKVQELEASMSPLELAKSRLAGWTQTLADRLGDESASAEDVAIAQRKVAEYSSKAAAEQSDLERATRGVTEAMLEQADQARARVDSNFAYEDSLNSVEDAQAALAEAQKNLTAEDENVRTSMEDVSRAALDLNKAYDGQVAAAGRVASSNLPASMDDAQRAILGAKGELDELNRLIAAGVVLPPSMEQYRQQLIQVTGEADGTALAQAQLTAALGEVGAAVSAIPGSKAVMIEAPTAELRQRLIDLGFQVKEIPGTKDVEVRALTEEAKANVGNLSGQLTNLDNQVTDPNINANPNPLLEAARRSMTALWDVNAQRPTPVAGLNDWPLRSTVAGVHGQLTDLGRRWINPQAALTVNGVSYVENAINYAARNRSSTITVNARIAGGATVNSLGLAAGGNIGRAVRGFDAGGSPSRRSDGRLVGPGGPLDDLIPAMTAWGEIIRVANKEWIINGRVSALMGDKKMAMLNAGLADIVPRFATGGRVVFDERREDDTAYTRWWDSLKAAGWKGRPGDGAEALYAPAPAPAPAPRPTLGSVLRPQPAPAKQVAPSGSRIDNLHVHLNGVFDLRDRAGMRKLAVELRNMLDTIEREAR